jgi:NAD(P)-dependent dehydrogenase (short-subunit alcohol dehydrogenase family)
LTTNTKGNVMNDLKGKVVLISGESSGIGAVAALASALGVTLGAGLYAASKGFVACHRSDHRSK